jgi:hypothetical protein
MYADWNGAGRAKSMMQPLTIAYTSPKVVSEPMCPMFKTPRQAGNRGLVSDSFHTQGVGWGSSAPPAYALPYEPGFGAKAHKDGYNVLYANYSTKWYDDPAQRLIWWVNPSTPGKQACGALVGLGHTYPYAWGEGVGASGDYAGGEEVALLELTPLAWHILDQYGGSDQNVGPENWVRD